jgi:hypothetical protein
MVFIYPSTNNSIIDGYVNGYNKTQRTDISRYCYDVATKNSIQKNYQIIADYIDKGDYVEPDILSDKIHSKSRISQITFILLKRYMKNYYSLD